MKESQTKRILAYLQKGSGITPLYALRMFGCLRLGARIYDLKKAGHSIATEIVDVGDGKRVARYKLDT